MDKIKKILNRLLSKDLKTVQKILLKVQKNDFKGLDIKKLKTHKNVFRIRKGDIRIIFSKTDKEWRLMSIEKRDDNTYKF